MTWWTNLLLLLTSLVNISHLKSVTSVLNANWECTPLQLEASEFIAEENNANFFKFITDVGGRTYQSAEAEYDDIIMTADEMFPDVTISLLKLSLSLRQYSPRVLMFNEIAEEVKGTLGCSTFLLINTKPICVSSDLIIIPELFKSVPETDKTKLTKYDHVYYDNPANPQIILYCDFRTTLCHKTHVKLTELADSDHITYIFRHYYIPSAGRVQLSGYGVELAIKSTEYTAVDDTVVAEDEKEKIMKTREEEEVEGFRFGVLKEKYPDLVEKLNQFRDHLIESKDAMKPLKAWEIADLGYQAAQKIASSMEVESLGVLTKYSQNLPSLARSLCRTQVKQELRSEIKSNQKILERYSVQPGSSVLLLNGMLIDLESADPFTLLKKLRGEAKTVGGLASLGIKFAEINTLLKSDLYRQNIKYGIDMRDDAVLYINNLEKDAEYSYWPGSVSELLRPSYPGMLKHLRKNINNLVLVIKPSDTKQTVSLLTLVATLLEHKAPIRIGLVFTSAGDEDKLSIDTVLPAAIYKIQNVKGKGAIKDFLLELAETEDDFNLKNIKSEFGDLVSGVELTEEFIVENGALLSAGNQFATSSGVKSSSVIVNGVVINDLTDVDEVILQTLQTQLPKLQRAVYLGEVNDETNILDWFMNNKNILPRHNPLILSTTAHSVHLAELAKSGQSYADLEKVLEAAVWFGDAEGVVSVVLVGDYSSKQGAQLLGSVLNSLNKVKKSKFTLLYTDNNDINFATWLAQLHGTKDTIVNTLGAILDSGVGSLTEETRTRMVNEELRAKFAGIVRTHKIVAHTVLHIAADSTGVMCNGRVITPLINTLTQDIELLETFELRSGASKLNNILAGYDKDIVMRAASILRTQEAVNRISFPDLLTEHSAVIVPGEGPFEVEAILDPLSKGAQQISHILNVLHSANLIKLRIVLNPREKLSEMPVQRFYRYVLEKELQFNEEGEISQQGAMATFTALLPHLLLTMSLNTPINWMVASTHSPHDLDNIKLNDIGEQGVHAEYTLDSLVIEGHSHDPLRYNNPTKGLQYVLKSGKVAYDTIVMANLGYFQLKALPGVWELSLREGPSRDIYKIAGVHGPGDLEPSGHVTITVGDLTSTFITVDATKKKGMEGKSVSEENQKVVNEEQGGIWDSLKSAGNSFVGGDGTGSVSSVNETINIFSVASGHLYERMLGVMMQSVLAHTKNPVKFWFLKNYLSPKFISSVPTIAKALGCEIEFVQYQWPSWLQAQSEKQRIIWGYKILFLDVLFPLNVKKFIFVDADQIVRADMKELIDLDLKGAPYGYTPFCDDRPEMDGFRFWKQGYWRNHLMGRAYHISALYVVDLQRFRQISAGDRLRGQYQGLSQDPNSLSNLDQDLPNNMIHHVPIHSLPQEWLWCETWCSDSSKAYAKTIDLCNNPQTKEPKLDRAMRIAPEWKEYDKKLKQILENTAEIKKTEEEKETKADVHSEL